MLFKASLATLASAAAAVGVFNSTQTSIVGTTVVTVTSCSNNACSETTSATGLAVVYDVSTLYTTYCPLTSGAPYSSASGGLASTTSASSVHSEHLSKHESHVASTSAHKNHTSASIEAASGDANRIYAGAAVVGGIFGALLV